MNIRGILFNKGSSVATIAPDASVADAAEALDRLGIGALVVSVDGTAIAGVFSERDLARGLAAHGERLPAMRVDELMTTDVVTCEPTDAVIDLMGVMTERRVRHIPVVDGGRLTGIVSIGDIVKWRLDELETERATLQEYLTTGR